MIYRFIAIGLLAAAALTSRAAELSFFFSQDQLGQTPPGFQAFVYGEGGPAEWRVIEAEVPGSIPAITAAAPIPRKPVLAQLSEDPTDERYPILVYTNEIFRDFTFSTRLQCVSGVTAQMAGLVFRFVDAQNFYYIRISASGNTLRFFKVVGGQRSNAIGPEIPFSPGVWYELSVECEGNRIRCFLDGKQAIPDMTDNSLSEGKLGFFTKSDAVSYFTDARVTYTPRESFASVLLRQSIERYPRVLGLRIYAIPPGQSQPSVVASLDESEQGQPGGENIQDVLARDSIYFGRTSAGVAVTMPLHDRNGETVAAVRVEMRSFPGQTEANAIARARPILQEMSRRMADRKTIF